MQPTEQQLLILKHDANAVIIAAPGSGKTFVISQRIRATLKNCKEHKGVIAISYTNKASTELRERSLKNGLDPKASFFGTIDKFYIGEIIIPFGKLIWGFPANEFSITTVEKLDEEQQKIISWLERDQVMHDLESEHLQILRSFFRQGIIILETVGVLANFVLSKSKACKNYLQARYLSIYIDEYQDCGANQHSLFETIVGMGIKGIAVGDLNQSIYGFSGKSSKYLSILTNKPEFKTFKLDKNHRCTASIINYSNYLLNPKIQLLPTEKLNVKFVRVTGNEVNIADWIDQIIPKINQQGVKNSQIAILTRSQRTSEIINSHLKTSHRLVVTTDLDMNLNIWSAIFSNLLRFAYDSSFRFIEVIQDYLNFERMTLESRRKFIEFRDDIRGLFLVNPLNTLEIIGLFTTIAEMLAPNAKNRESIKLLSQVLSLQTQLDAYKPTGDNDVTVMTLHKSKGLEFDVVFHLDLYTWVFPQKEPGPNNDFDNPTYGDYHQDLNLHYVGITRARKACFLISSTQRTNNQFKPKQAKDSEFLWLNDIKKLRL